MSVTTRKCTECGEWYDARASACYVCGQEEREVNAALVKAAETTRLNSALSQQVGVARMEQSAEQTLQQARRAGDLGRARPRVPGYQDLVQTVKDGLEERPDIIDYYASGGG